MRQLHLRRQKESVRVKSMEWIVASIDYGVIVLLLAMSVVALGVAIERGLNFRSISLSSFGDLKSLELSLTRRLHIIATVGSNAPYVGLLGTVLGIMFTFATIGQQGMTDPGKIMTGLALALKATAVGLLVAIPAVVLYNFLLRRAKELMLQWEILYGRKEL
ncbi:MAG: TonB-system energizer ExbB [Smithellaceae bacterium]